MRENEISEGIIGCAIEVHIELGPELLESVYEEALCRRSTVSRESSTGSKSRSSAQLSVSGVPGQVWLFSLTERSQTCELLVRHVVAAPRSRVTECGKRAGTVSS